MKTIEKKIREAFTQFKTTNDAYQLAHDIARITDYSVRYSWQIEVLIDIIKKLKEEESNGP